MAIRNVNKLEIWVTKSVVRSSIHFEKLIQALKKNPFKIFSCCLFFYNKNLLIIFLLTYFGLFVIPCSGLGKLLVRLLLTFGVFGVFGAFWCLLMPFGNFQEFLGIFGAFWGLLGPFGAFLGPFWAFWGLLGPFQLFDQSIIRQ